MEDANIKIAVMEKQVEPLIKQQEILAKKIEKLTEVMKKGKGAFASALFISGTVGAGITTIVSHFFKG